MRMGTIGEALMYSPYGSAILSVAAAASRFGRSHHARRSNTITRAPATAIPAMSPAESPCELCSLATPTVVGIASPVDGEVEVDDRVPVILDRKDTEKLEAPSLDEGETSGTEVPLDEEVVDTTEVEEESEDDEDVVEVAVEVDDLVSAETGESTST